MFWRGTASALVGAVVGGVLAIGGAVWVMRRERTRIHREAIYSQLIPALERHLGLMGELAAVIAAAAALRRVARLASNRDHSKATAIEVLAIESAGAWGIHNSDEQDAEARRKLGLATDAIDAYSEWLETKL